MTAAKFKRFYAQATWEAVVPDGEAQAGPGFCVLLDS